MLWPPAFISLALALAAATGVEASNFKHSWEHIAEVHERMDEKVDPRNFIAARDFSDKRQLDSKFLNDNTSKFAVNGSKLPDIDFDIGESYAGLLPIGQSNDTELFFWFFPSTDGSVTEEIVIWFTGGPGCSSMSGLFAENGPVTWIAGTFAPVLNPWSWHRLSNVVWIEQPVGVGYTTGTPIANNEDEVAQQFMGFWKNFVDTFGMHNYSIYVTGESYAGLYCPYVSSNMLDAADPEYFNVSGMLIYDGVYSDGGPSEQIPLVPFVDYWGGLFPFNDSYRESIHERHEKCGYQDYLDKYLVYPASGQQPSIPPGVSDNYSSYLDGCNLFDDIYSAILTINPCFNIYQVAAGCPLPYDPLGFPAGNEYTPPGAPPVYFNRSEVKEALHVPLDSDWAICKGGILRPDYSLPSHEHAIPNVVDKTQNVMLVHGALDMVLLANGTLLAIQNMTFGGKLGFEEQPTKPLYVPAHYDQSPSTWAGSGILGTAHTERGLTYAAVALSGHMVPEYQPSVAYRQLEVLLGRVENLQSVTPFTTDTNSTEQPTSALGLGTGPQSFASAAGNGSNSGSGSCSSGSGSQGGNSTVTNAGSQMGVTSWMQIGVPALLVYVFQELL
ncbi:Alpha/Beta hydrolase protein [Pseudomassariella vexata]|uniref:Carboxypeptidase n=1 Tax=Pseudomassariella vexata TaxID=1141098 RepID=A0A1Y2E8B2_9PEZI|nr:Alpha/Beta hydrolase protein [Pseudomassariella vexata]ORY67779.1 Alpha/Beta hydrolase protein [Pseudomassariella vexata]